MTVQQQRRSGLRARESKQLLDSKERHLETRLPAIDNNRYISMSCWTEIEGVTSIGVIDSGLRISKCIPKPSLAFSYLLLIADKAHARRHGLCHARQKHTYNAPGIFRCCLRGGKVPLLAGSCCYARLAEAAEALLLLQSSNN